ncbi:MAG TPA: hypothetical protein VFU36_01895 [Jatrophihabitans sp.]|nr:hypothetical protein [Jatrophihabitans sp.]
MSRRAGRPDRVEWPEDRRGPVAGFNVSVPRLALATRRLSFGERQPVPADHRAVPVPALADRRQWRRPALLVRLAQLVAGLAVLLLAPHPHVLVVLVMLLGLFGAVISPARTGQAIVLAAGIAGWVFGYGAHGSPPVLRVLAFAVALFALHDATSLASTVPLTADLRPEALFGWLRRSAAALLVAGVLAGVVYGVGALVSFHSSYPLVLAGLFGIAAALGVAAWLFSRSLR